MCSSDTSPGQSAKAKSGRLKEAAARVANRATVEYSSSVPPPRVEKFEVAARAIASGAELVWGLLAGERLQGGSTEYARVMEVKTLN